MASTIKVDKIEGSTGSTITVPTGQTLTVTDGIPVASGGTGLASFTAGDILYATGSTTLAKLGKGTAEQVLAMNSGATAPDWGSVDLTVLPTITVAKGGTNIASFVAGDILYATGTTTLAKLAKGTTLQHLRMNAGATAPEWTAAPSGGAWTLIKSQTITSSTADMEFINGTDDVVFDSTYKAYVLLFTDYLPSADDSSLVMQIRNTGGSYITSAYCTVGYESLFDTGTMSAQAINSTTSMIARNHLGNLTTETASGQLWMYNPSNTASYPYLYYNITFGGGGSSNARNIVGVGAKRVAYAWDAFKILPNTGTIENLQATLYGITT